MNRVNGNWTLYKRLILLFVEHHADSADKLDILINDNAFKEAAALAHGVKGTCGNISAIKLYLSTKDIESACISKNIDAAKAHLASFRGHLQTLLEGALILK